jgi:hypothetical protein
MAIQVQGNGGTVADVDGTVFRALRTTPRPIDYGVLGHYRVANNVSLLVTQAAAGTLWSFRWGDATRFAVIGKIKLQCIQTAAATATIMPNIQVFIARSFTVSDSAGTALTLTGNNMKKRTSMGTTLVTDFRVSTAAAGLTVGTRTLDSSPILVMPTQQTITTPNATVYAAELDIGAGDGNHPIVLAQNEGIIVQGPSIVFGAAGTATLSVEISWAEVTAY